MNTIRGALWDRCRFNAGVIAIVADRVYTGVAPADTDKPYIVIHPAISDVPARHLQGASGLSRMRAQFDCWASDSDTAWALREAVRLAMENYRGDIGTVTVRSIALENTSSDTFAPESADELPECVERLDFSVHYVEQVPAFV